MPPKKQAGGHNNANKPYSKAEPIANGEILTDISGKQWKIGKSIGSGGFGEIYLASDEVSKPVNDKANFVVKIEPYTNGPLFVEIAFYIRAAKLDMGKILDLYMYNATNAADGNNLKSRIPDCEILVDYLEEKVNSISDKHSARTEFFLNPFLILPAEYIYQYQFTQNLKSKPNFTWVPPTLHRSSVDLCQADEDDPYTMQTLVEEWKQKNKIESLGMPFFIGSGSHDYNSQKYRFMVIPRFGQDLSKILLDKPGKRLGLRTVLAVSLQVIDIYEYIHSKEFVHADVKASNLALELHANPKKKSVQQVFLLDYGLALKYVGANGQHIQYGPDARKAHNGTLEYASRDAHIGAFSRRGDLEVLGYNMIEWLCGKLPWGTEGPPDKAHKQKQAFMADPTLKKIYPSEIQGLDIIEKFLRYVAKLQFDEKPNYNLCRDMLRKGLPASPKGSLFLEDLGAGVAVPKSKAATKRGAATVAVPDEVDSISKRICVPQVEEEEQNPKRSTRTTKKVKDFNWARILSTDPEKIVRAATSLSQQASTGKEELNGHKQLSPVIANPTPAMLQILSKKKENIRSPIKAKLTQPEGSSGLTPAMKEILMRKKKTATPTSKAKPKPAASAVVAASSTSTRPRRTRT